ncbi:GNAT family N-acetyltransferase [Ornithinimicrobium sp. F0845]|uniref:GNAT family N-acetyltransferase n=1 Tax=Ornithinimicrobium sp. F0845 TaxID=2926412 RepID=UPI001FF550C8|nr:GNAT family N-acetyltransferase [Ornithinimicrobium sp. F0845]MCK0112141.1 GNAT family N-acetyltransferase [Ornithinimicrobium sp. F0845]
MPGEPSMRPVTDARELEQVYAVLLAPSFPPSELHPPDWLTHGVSSGAVSVLVAEDASGPVATAVTESLGPSPVVLLTYFATRADLRGRGVGSALFGGMLDAVLDRDRTPLVLAEVERPDRHTGSPEFGDPTARLRFYGRHGARVLDLPYFQPPIGAQPPVHGMLLLALHADEQALTLEADGTEAVTADYLWPAIDAVLDGAGPAGQSPAADRLRAASRVPGVRLYPVEDYARVEASRAD